jgi:hypothetical protein
LIAPEKTFDLLLRPDFFPGLEINFGDANKAIRYARAKTWSMSGDAAREAGMDWAGYSREGQRREQHRKTVATSAPIVEARAGETKPGA